MQCFITFSRIQEWFWDTWWIRVMGSIWSLVKWNRIISKAVLSILYAGFSSHLTERPGWWKNKKSYKLIQSPYCPGWRGKSHSPFCRPLRQWWSPRHTWKHWGGGVTFSFQYFMLEKTELSCFSYESLSSLANECSLRDILHGPHSPAHLLCSEELQPHSETNNNKAIISSTSRQEH